VPLARRAVAARWGGEACGEHLRTAEGDVAASGAAARSEGLPGEAVRDAGRSVSELNRAHRDSAHRDSARRVGDGGCSSATAPAQNLPQGGKTTKTVSACHSASLRISWPRLPATSVVRALSPRNVLVRPWRWTREGLRSARAATTEKIAMRPMTTVPHWTGAQTKALRQAMRLSIRAFAAHLGVDTRTVNKWEAQGNTITLLPDNQALLDTALARAPEDVKTRFTQTLNSNEQQQHTNQAQPVERATPHTTIPAGDWGVVSDPPSIATIRTMSEFFQVADRKLGGGLLYHSVTRYIKLEISPNLLDPPRDCSSSELFSAAASLTEIAGRMAHDGGSDDKAQRHFNQAYHLAVAAENPALSANVCASLSHLAVQHGQAEDAARISAAGLTRATQGEGTEELVARLYAMRARAAAMQSREKECHLSLDAARDTLCNYRDSLRAGWVAGFDEAALAGESALCFYSLGALNEAENEARKVIELRRTGDRVRSRAFGQLMLANVLFKTGAIDEAARVGSEICLVARSLSSARVRSGLSRLGKSFGASPAVPEVALFLDRPTQLTEKSTAASRDQTRWPL
jgi:DNA-binding transcriptional regulator YiaG